MSRSSGKVGGKKHSGERGLSGEKVEAAVQLEAGLGRHCKR